MSTIFCFIGVDGSGIYEYFNIFAKEYKDSYIPINGDLIKTDFPNNGSYQSKYNASRAIRKKIQEAISTGKNVLFYDSENIRPEYRKIVFGNGADVVAIYLDIRLEECLENNRKHERYINEGRIYSDYRDLRPPTRMENFNHIFYTTQEGIDKLIMNTFKSYKRDK